MEKYTCECCGKEFEHEKKSGKHVFCSKICSWKYHIGDKHPKSKGVTLRTCKYCNNQFEAPTNSMRYFCSRNCFYAQHAIDMSGEKHPLYIGKIKKYCKYCGKEFEVYAKAKLGVTFCSHECSALWWGENHCGEKNARWAPKIKKTCLNCGKNYEIIPSVDKRGKGKFCSKTCSNEWQSKNALSGVNHPNWKQKVQKRCKYCGKMFEALPSAVVDFCGHECNSAWRDKYYNNERICLNCGKHFRVTPSTKKKFCSITCSIMYLRGDKSPNWKERIKRFCKQCGKQFEGLESDTWGTTYCSRSCFNKWYSENKSGKNSHRWKQITQTCIECGKEFTTYPARVQKHSRGKFCSKKCASIWQGKNIHGQNHPSWIDGRSFLPYCSKFNSRLKEMVRKRDDRVCQLCGLSEKENGKKLDVHHIHYDKENCYPDLIALCCKCNIVVNKRIMRSNYEQMFMNNLNDRGLLFWTKYPSPS